MRNQSKAALTVKMMAIDAMLIAMHVVLNTFSLKALNFKFTFDSFPIVVGAVMFGPLHGSLIGLLGSACYQFFFSGYGITPTTPLWILPAVVRGLIIGIYSKKKSFEPPKKGLVAICILAGVVVTSLNTVAIYTDSMLFNYFSYELVFGSIVPRYIASIIIAVVFALIVPALIKGIRKNIRL